MIIINTPLTTPNKSLTYSENSRMIILIIITLRMTIIILPSPP